MEKSQQEPPTEIIEAEYTTPSKSEMAHQVVPPYPLNSKYEKQSSTSNPANENSVTEASESTRSTSNHDLSSSLSESLPSADSEGSDNLHLPETSEEVEVKELVTESNVESLYTELCELEHLFVNELSLEWFYFIFEGVQVDKIKTLFKDIDTKLGQERNVICPDKDKIWEWAKAVGSPNDVKIVIIGQDPSIQYVWDVKVMKYIPMSSGVAFAVSEEYHAREKTLDSGKSLRHIMKIAAPVTADSDLFDGNLRPWTEQGVLLINSCLTTAVHRPEYRDDFGPWHCDLGWEFITRLIVEKLGSATREPIVLMPWGASAKKLVSGAQIHSKHKVIEACHPVWQTYSSRRETPLKNCSCDRYCWLLQPENGAEPRNDFKTAKEFLEQQGRGGIIWDCFGKKALLRRKSTNIRENLEKDTEGVTKKGSENNVNGNYRKRTTSEAEEGEKENVNGETPKRFKTTKEDEG